MTQFYLFNGADLGNTVVRLGSLQGITQGAEMGQIGTSQITFDDPNGALSLDAFYPFVWNESAATPIRIFGGYATDRDYERGGDSFRTGAARHTILSVIDVNAVLSFRLIRPGQKRPAETDIARITWLINTFMEGHVVDSGLIDSTGPVNMPANDYAGQFPNDVMMDCATTSGKNYWVYFDPTTSATSLAYFKTTDAPTLNPSTLSISNVRADLSSTVIAPEFPAHLQVDTSQTYSGVYLTGSFPGGSVYVRNAAIVSTRDTAAAGNNVTTKAAATALANKMLAAAANQAERVSCIVKLPKAQVNLITAGMGITAKFTEFPNWSTGLTVTVLNRTVAQDEENQDFYNVSLTLGHPLLVNFSPGGSPDNNRNPPSNNTPFVPVAGDYPTMVVADGALHAWKFNDADRAGSTVTDYADGDNGTTTNTGTNPTGAAGPASISGGANNWHLQRTDVNGTTTVVSSDDGADWPSGNTDWTVEYWGDYITTFLDYAFYTQWGHLAPIFVRVGGSPTSVTITPTLVTLSTVSGSQDISAYTGVGWHHFAVTYVGSTRTFTTYVDGAARWVATGSADIATDVPSIAGGTTIEQYAALQDYRHGWQAIYPLALSPARVAAHALGDAGATNVSSPSLGQPVAGELVGTGDGTTTVYTTNYDYAPNSLHVTVCGIPQVITETSPSTGVFTLATPAPSGCPVIAVYTTAAATPTGSTNPQPTPGTTTVPSTSKLLTNKSGGSVAAGDVVIVDTTNNDAFTTTTSAAVTKIVGIAQATIASNAVGAVLVSGYAPLVNTTASVTRGNYAETSTTVKKATENATRHAGSFAQYLTGGTTPDAILFGVPDSSSGGGTTSPLTTKGDVWGYSSTDARIPVGANATVLTADSTQTLGVKWAAAAVSPLTTKGDLWGYSTVDARLPVGSNTQVLTADSTQTLGVKWAAASAGGSSAYPLDSYTLDGTYGDHFTAASLSGIWTRRNYTSGAETRQLGQAATYMRIDTTGRGAGDGYFQTAPGGDWTFMLSYVNRSALAPSLSLAVVNSVGTGCAVHFYSSPNTLILIGVTTYSTYAGTFVQRTEVIPAVPDGKIWLSLRKSGTNYFGASSFDGEIFSEETPAFSSAITVDRVGFMNSPLGNLPTFIDIDVFNKIA